MRPVRSEQASDAREREPARDSEEPEPALSAKTPEDLEPRDKGAEVKGGGFTQGDGG